MLKDTQSQNLLALHGRANILHTQLWFERYCSRQHSKATSASKHYKFDKHPRVYIHVGASSRRAWSMGTDAMHESAAEVSG